MFQSEDDKNLPKSKDAVDLKSGTEINNRFFEDSEITRSTLSDSEDGQEQAIMDQRMLQETGQDISVNNICDSAAYAIDDMDDGKTNLYPNLKFAFPFKTSETLLDGILSDVSFIKKGTGILKLPTIAYSKERDSLFQTSYSTNLLYLNDQITLKTKYSYVSKKCPNPKDCKITVAMSTLFENDMQVNTTDDVENIKLYHLKITIKERPQMNLRLKEIERFHLVSYDDLHEFDKLDVVVEPVSLDSAIYISPTTNKLIMIEIMNSEFSKEELATLKIGNIEKRYNEYYGIEKSVAESETTDKDIEKGENGQADEEKKADRPMPSQIKCINFLLKILKGALSETCIDDKKRILKDNAVLNTQMDTNILLDNFKFNITKMEEIDIEKESGEEGEKALPDGSEFYEAPDLFDFENNNEQRLLRDAYSRKALEIVFIGQIFQSFFNDNHDYFKFYQSSSSVMFWFTLVGQYVGNPNVFLTNLGKAKYYNLNYNFINLNAFMHYLPHTLITNFKLSIQLDPENTNKYYDSLEYVSSIYNNKQLFQYVGSLDFVGDEALKKALSFFELVDDGSLNETRIYDAFKTKKTLAVLSNQQNNQSSLISLKNSLRTFAKYINSPFLKFLVDHEPYSTYTEAYKVLELDSSITDYEWIQTSYMIKVSDQPNLKADSDRALFTIAVYLKSLQLITLLFQQEPSYELYFGNLNELSITDAYKELGINENCGEDTIIEVFKANWDSINTDHLDVQYVQLLLLRRALLKVAIYKNSKMLENYVQTGIVDESCLPNGNWPVGLCNVGNTCYLNSLLQYYFSIAPLRNYILNYSEKTENLIKENARRRIGGREVSTFEVQRSTKFISQLRNLYLDMINTKYKLSTPSQQLVYLAFAPAEFIQQQDTNTLVDIDGDVNERNADIEISPDQLEMSLEIGRQQDVTECVGNFMDQLETVTLPLKLDKNFEQFDLIKKIFYGVVKQNMIKVSTNEIIKDRQREERFSSLLVNLSSKPRNLYDAMDQFFNDEEEIEISELGKVKRVLEVVDLPLILQIQIQRVEFDKVNYVPIKNIDPLPFGEKIYLDKYMENGVPTEAKESYEVKKQLLLKMKAEKNLILSKNEVGHTVKTALVQTKRFLESDFVSTELDMPDEELSSSIEHLKEAHNLINEQLESLTNKISEMEKAIDSHFDEFQNSPYSLFAVFVHRGEASYGHYWIYIKDFNSQIWRKYNDEAVTEVPEDEVFNFAVGNTATPYFLAYIKDNHKMEVEPLKRAVDEVENNTANNDVVMEEQDLLQWD